MLGPDNSTNKFGSKDVSYDSKPVKSDVDKGELKISDQIVNSIPFAKKPCETVGSLKGRVSVEEKLEIQGPTKTIEGAYQTLGKDLQEYVESNSLKKGALLVQVIGVPGSEEPILFGKLSATSAEPVDRNTVGRTGSGCKLWTALLTKIITKKYHKYIAMDDRLGKFAPQEALKKFVKAGPHGEEVDGSDLAKEITVEGLVGMTAGLEYEDQAPKHDTGTTLDQVMRGNEIKDGSIHILYDPRDKITLYSNYIALTAYPIEKAYKKVLAEEYILDKRKTLEVTNGGKILPRELQNLSLGELLNCKDAYIRDAYVYDLIDLFLADENPPLNSFTYDKILQKELFQPMGMNNSGFYETPGIAMDLTFEDAVIKEDASKPLKKEHPMVRGMSYGRTTLSDATKLMKGLVGSAGLIAETDGHVLLSKEDLNEVFASHGHYKAWGLGGVELSCGGRIVDKGGWVNQDQYSCWFDLNSGVGMIAMCNCGRRPDAILAKFKKEVEHINYPQEKPIIKDVEGTKLGIPIAHYFAHPLERSLVQMLFDGTRGRVALLFNYDEDQEGIMHWSGTPLKVEKQADGTFCITTPGRFKGISIQKIQGNYTGHNYLAIGDTSFVEIDKNRIPSEDEMRYAQKEFENFCGVYTNYEEREHSALHFVIEQDGSGNKYLCAGETGCELVPQNIVKVEKNAISFNGHDRQPPDKIFRFKRDAEGEPWRLQVTDYISTEVIIEERSKDV